MKLASELKKCLQEVKEGTTATEFVRWCLFLEEQPRENTKWDYFLAHICAYIDRLYKSWVGDKSEIDVNSYLIANKLTYGGKKKKQKPKYNAAHSKMCWMAFAYGAKAAQDRLKAELEKKEKALANGTRIPIRNDLGKRRKILHDDDRRRS
jgi:hypothetical protein